MHWPKIWIVASVVGLFLFVGNIIALPKDISIGGLFDSQNDALEVAFRHAVERVNTERWLKPRTRLYPLIVQIAKDDSFHASKRVCALLKNGVGAFIGPTMAKTSSHVQSICNFMKVPHIETRWDFRSHKFDSSVNLYPHPIYLSKVFASQVGLWSDWWKSFTLIYEDNDGLSLVQELLKLNGTKLQVMQLGSGDDHRPLLKRIKKSGVKNIILQCAIGKVYPILKQAQQLGMINLYYGYLITNLDFHTIDLDDFKPSGVNITGFQMIDPRNDSLYNDIFLRWRFAAPMNVHSRNIDSPEQGLTTGNALLYDAVMLFTRALSDLSTTREMNVVPMSCESNTTSYYGSLIIDYMRKANLTGVTGPLRFNSEGFRTDFNVKVVKLTQNGLIRISTWNSQVGIIDAISARDLLLEAEASLANKTVIVTAIQTEPFFMNNSNAESLDQADRYVGYAVDLVEELSKVVNFNYIIRPVADGKHGSEKNKGEWNGMIGELIHEQADFAIGDLTITQARQTVVEFTNPFMPLGISILYKEESKADPEVFSFLKPLSEEVWIYMITAYLGVSITMFILARITPTEWDNPHPCNPDPDELENQFNLLNCMWFAIGSLMQQGCDFLPKAVSTRTVAGIWWFFTLIMISSYTANLAAFLTSARMSSPINNAEDLSRQTKIKYGSVRDGSTMNFFRTSKVEAYKQMWNFMSAAEPSVFVDSNNEGVERVKKGEYAFLMESTSVEYVIERECNLMQVGGLLDSKGYGIATRKGSPFLSKLNKGVLTLQDRGVLLKLKKRWWNEMAGTHCKKDDDKPSGSENELGILNVGGVFVVLMAGTVVAVLVAIAEFVWNTRQTVREERDSVCSEMAKELKFVLTCSDSSKPINKSTAEPENGMPFSNFS